MSCIWDFVILLVFFCFTTVNRTPDPCPFLRFLLPLSGVWEFFHSATTQFFTTLIKSASQHRLFSFSPNIVKLFWFCCSGPSSISLSPLFIMNVAHFSLFNSIPISWPCTLILWICVSSYFSFLQIPILCHLRT